MDDYVQLSNINDYLTETRQTNLVYASKKRKELFEMCLTAAGFVVHEKKRVRGDPIQKSKVVVGIQFSAIGWSHDETI